MTSFSTTTNYSPIQNLSCSRDGKWKCGRCGHYNNFKAKRCDCGVDINGSRPVKYSHLLKDDGTYAIAVEWYEKIRSDLKKFGFKGFSDVGNFYWVVYDEQPNKIVLRIYCAKSNNHKYLNVLKDIIWVDKVILTGKTSEQQFDKFIFLTDIKKRVAYFGKDLLGLESKFYSLIVNITHDALYELLGYTIECMVGKIIDTGEDNLVRMVFDYYHNILTWIEQDKNYAINTHLALIKGEEDGYDSLSIGESGLLATSNVMEGLEFPPFIEHFRTLKLFRKQIMAVTKGEYLNGDCYRGSKLAEISRKFNTKLYIFAFNLTQKTKGKWYRPE